MILEVGFMLNKQVSSNHWQCHLYYSKSQMYMVKLDCY